MELQKIRDRGGRVTIQDVREAVKELGVSLTFGEYTGECGNSMCPMEAVARACGLRDHDSLVFGEMFDDDGPTVPPVMSTSYQNGFIREYDRSGHGWNQHWDERFIGMLWERPDMDETEYKQGMEDGAKVRAYREVLLASGV